MKAPSRTSLLVSLLFLFGPSLVVAGAPPAFPLKLSENRRHLVDQQGRRFFRLGDTPWFVQKQRIQDVRMLMDDLVAKGFHTLFLELLDDEHIPPIDAQGRSAFRYAGDGKDHCRLPNTPVQDVALFNFNETMHNYGLDRQFRGEIRGLQILGSRIGGRGTLSVDDLQKQQP